MTSLLSSVFPALKRHRFAFWLAGILMLAGAAHSAETVIIAEFMASNTRTIADENGSFEDWIELRNTGSQAVDLAGWSLTGNPNKPRQWLFPATNIAAGAHLIVWASKKDRRIPGAPLHTSFKLGASGEYLALVRPDGSVATEFKPKYPPQSPDVSYGFLPGVAEPVNLVAPTPGQPNESVTKLPGPSIMSVTNVPALPNAKEAITVRARIKPVFGEVTNVVLHWCPMFQRETDTSMRTEGDGLWTATIPAGSASPAQMIRWRVTAEDTAGRPSRYPLFSDAKSTSKYLGAVVSAAGISSALPVFHLFIAPQQIGSAESERGAQACFYYDGEFYDNVFIKVRGNTTAHFPKRSHRLEFPRDHQLRHPGPGGRIRHTSLMAEWGDPTYLRQHLSFWLETETGAAAPFHYPVRVQLNGNFWQLAMHSQVLDEELLERHGLDPNGALYKAVGTLTTDFNSTGGFEKKTRRKEGEEDYVALARALSERRSLTARRAALFDLMNLPATINYLAVARITQEDDDIWANLSLYHDCDGTGEWRPIPFDMNVSWGLSFQQGGVHATDDNFRSHPFFGADNVGVNQGFNRLYDAVVRVPETRQMLLRRMRTILDQWWQPPATPVNARVIERHITQLTNQIWMEAIRDRQKWGNSWNAPENIPPSEALSAGVRELIERFIEPRRKHFYVTHSVLNQKRRVGITSRDNAGIPEAQPADVRIEITKREASGADPYLCLTNANAFAVDLSGWKLEGDARFTFEPGTVLPAGGLLYVARDLKSFRAQADKKGSFVVGNLKGPPGSMEHVDVQPPTRANRKVNSE